MLNASQNSIGSAAVTVASRPLTKLCFAILATVGWLAAISVADASDDALLKAELESLQGVWANVSTSAEGVDDGSYSDLLWLTIKGDKWLMSVK